MGNRIIMTAALMGALAVGIGAFGAHGLEDTLQQNDRVDTFETAVKYHFYHVLAMLFIGLIAKMGAGKPRILSLAAYAMFAGVVLFSGSLYVLSITNITILGAITPLGGVFFIAGWLLLFWGMKKAAE